jgi:hypothetical protein
MTSLRAIDNIASLMTLYQAHNNNPFQTQAREQEAQKMARTRQANAALIDAKKDLTKAMDDLAKAMDDLANAAGEAINGALNRAREAQVKAQEAQTKATQAQALAEDQHTLTQSLEDLTQDQNALTQNQNTLAQAEVEALMGEMTAARATISTSANDLKLANDFKNLFLCIALVQRVIHVEFPNSNNKNTLIITIQSIIDSSLSQNLNMSDKDYWCIGEIIYVAGLIISSYYPPLGAYLNYASFTGNGTLISDLYINFKSYAQNIYDGSNA